MNPSKRGQAKGDVSVFVSFCHSAFVGRFQHVTHKAGVWVKIGGHQPLGVAYDMWFD